MPGYPRIITRKILRVTGHLKSSVSALSFSHHFSHLFSSSFLIIPITVSHPISLCFVVNSTITKHDSHCQAHIPFAASTYTSAFGYFQTSIHHIHFPLHYTYHAHYNRPRFPSDQCSTCCSPNNQFTSLIASTFDHLIAADPGIRDEGNACKP